MSLTEAAPFNGTSDQNLSVAYISVFVLVFIVSFFHEVELSHIQNFPNVKSHCFPWEAISGLRMTLWDQTSSMKKSRIPFGSGTKRSSAGPRQLSKFSGEGYWDGEVPKK